MPAVMTRKIEEISFAFPAAERNRTRENAPATAIPVPMFPFTIRTTVVTMTGRITRERKKLRLTVFFTETASAVMKPQMTAMSRQSR